MPVKSIADTYDNERPECFIHIEELPWLAYHQDIRDFFQGLSVKEGGILIRQYHAFVAFDEPNDIDIAIRRKNRLLLGNEIQLSIISKAELRRTLFRLARRKLDFSEEGDMCKKAGSKSQIQKRKKIRPTPVVRGKKRKIEPFPIFCPIESDFPAPQYDNDAAVFTWTSDPNYFPCKKKKINPIRLSDSTDEDNYSIFHPEKCYVFTKMLLDV